MKRTVSICSTALAVAILAGCGEMPAQTSAPPALSPALQRFPATVARQSEHAVPAVRGNALIHGKVLIYAASGTNGGQIDIFHYPSGKLGGYIAGVGAGGMCVDAKGDVYVVTLGTTVYEYAHGGTSPLKEFSASGVGCSVDAKNDLAVTTFSPGGVEVFAKGDPSKGKTYSGGPCTYQWTMGYDENGNLIGVGEESTGAIVACALLAGSKSITALSGCCQSPITIDSPGGTMWDGKYIALGDQEAAGKFETGIWPAALSGTTLSSHREAVFTDTCYSDYADVLDPFIFGKKNTPVNHRRGTIMVGTDLWCNDNGSTGVEFWHYPQGGNPYKVWSGDGASGAVAVTIEP